mgnify:CR=1 FL=1
MPWHLELDALSEAEKGQGRHRDRHHQEGIGPTYMDKSERSGIRMHDFVDAERFEEVIRETCARKNRVITAFTAASRSTRTPLLQSTRFTQTVCVRWCATPPL